MPNAETGDDWLQSFIPYVLYRTTNLLNRRIRSRLRQMGVNIARWRVLSLLRAYGELNLGGIVELTAMEQPRISRIVAQLENEGFVARRIDANDSRVAHIRLTRPGEKAFDKCYPVAERHQAIALTGFTQKEIDQLAGYLRRIQHNIEAER